MRAVYLRASGRAARPAPLGSPWAGAKVLAGSRRCAEARGERKAVGATNTSGGHAPCAARLSIPPACQHAACWPAPELRTSSARAGRAAAHLVRDTNKETLFGSHRRRGIAPQPGRGREGPTHLGRVRSRRRARVAADAQRLPRLGRDLGGRGSRCPGPLRAPAACLRRARLHRCGAPRREARRTRRGERRRGEGHHGHCLSRPTDGQSRGAWAQLLRCPVCRGCERLRTGRSVRASPSRDRHFAFASEPLLRRFVVRATSRTLRSQTTPVGCHMTASTAMRKIRRGMPHSANTAGPHSGVSAQAYRTTLPRHA
jgi:hypothetical protein